METTPDIRRRLNDHRRRLFEDAAGEIAFLCECVDAECTRAVVLSPADFDDLRGRASMLLHPGHDALVVEPSALNAVQVELSQVELNPFEIGLTHVEPPEADPPVVETVPEPLQ